MLETRQIIPDKNLFGQSNFASNAFDVVIQLAKSSSKNMGPKAAVIAQNNQDMIATYLNNEARAIHNTTRTVPTGQTNPTMGATNRIKDETFCIANVDVANLHETDGRDEGGKLKGESDAVAMKDVLEIEDNDNDANTNGVAMMSREQTNSMLEGHDDVNHTT